MTDTLRILIVEDSEPDAILAQYEIRANLKDCEFHQVDDRQAFLDALQTFRPDLIISDYTMPQFDGMSALKLALQYSPQTPVIIWTGTINEDTAVQCMKAGANNYVLKDNIKRLGPAVCHALEERQVMLERSQAEEALRASEAKYRALVENLPDIIVRFDRSCRCLFVSPSVRKVLNFQPEEFIGKTPRQLAYDPGWAERWEGMIQASFDSGVPQRYEFAFEGNAGVVTFEWDLIPEHDAQGQVYTILTIARDITARKQAEEQVKLALAEKEALLKEVHHRVKNNLASIVALIGLQQEMLSDSAAIAELGELINRVHSMALVHEMLYQSESLSQVDLQDYFTLLATHVHAAYERFMPVELTILAFDVAMTLENAIPCGLVVNELLTNAFKYAFPDGRPRPGYDMCQITVIADRQGNTFTITVKDNGVGLPADFDIQASASLGLQLVMMLVQRQLDGQLELDQTEGTAFRLKFAVL